MRQIKKETTLFFISLLLFLSIGLYVFQQNKTSTLLEISFLNIGQGDATFLRTPNQKLYLIDVSSGPQILEALSEHLGFFEKKIDGIFLTHMDADHVGGIVAILEYFSVKNIYTTEAFDETSVYQDVVTFIKKEGIETSITKINGTKKVFLDSFDSKEIFVDILFPVKNYPFSDNDRNSRSMVLQIVYEEVSLLFTGDAPVEVEEYLIREVKTPLQSDLLQVGHHGSNTSTSEDFLKVVNPEYAIMSFGVDNDFGHPHPEVVTRLEDQEIITFDTKEKSITFITDGNSIVNIR